MVERSELIEKIEGTIISIMQEKAEAFSQRAKAYEIHCSREEIQAELREVEKLFSSVRSPGIIEKLTELKKQSIDKLNSINQSEKTLQERLELPIVINYVADQINVVLPLNAEERDKKRLSARLYKTLNVAIGSPEVPLSYCNLSVINTSKRKRKKIIKEIEDLSAESDFKEANVSFKIEELKLLLDLSKIGIAETELRYAIRPAETKEELEASYSIKDIAKRLNLTYNGADHVVRRFLKEKEMEHKKPGRGKQFEFRRGEFNAIVSYYETEGKIKKIEKKPSLEEKTFNIKDIAKRLSFSYSGAKQYLNVHAKELGIELPGKGHPYILSEPQFARVVELYESRKVVPKKAVEKIYRTKDIAKELGISYRSAFYRVKRLYKRHNIKHKPRTEWTLTQKQFDDVTAKRETIGANTYRNDVIEGLKAGKRDEQIRSEIRTKYGIKNPGVIQGAINLYKHKISRGEI